jgi:hypothetical protein
MVTAISKKYPIIMLVLEKYLNITVWSIFQKHFVE